MKLKKQRAECPVELYTSKPYNLMDYFEWDENKRLTNIKKHKMDFVDALHVFNDVDCKILTTFRNNEARYTAIGKIYGTVLYIVYAHRQAKKRIISARCASIKERKDYESSKFKKSN